MATTRLSAFVAHSFLPKDKTVVSEFLDYFDRVARLLGTAQSDEKRTTVVTYEGEVVGRTAKFRKTLSSPVSRASSILADEGPKEGLLIIAEDATSLRMFEKAADSSANLYEIRVATA